MVAMAVKHFLADFVLQTSSVARGKAAEHNWLGCLSLHAGLHAAGTLVVALVFAAVTWWVAPVEFVVHAAIDRGKVLLSRTLDLDIRAPGFWWLFGFDQLLHGLTNIAIVGVFLAAVST